MLMVIILVNDDGHDGGVDCGDDDASDNGDQQVRQ
jgi:hypothetical protein